MEQERRRWNLPAVLYSAVIVFTIFMLLASIPFGTYAVFYTRLSTIYSWQTKIASVPFYIGLLTIRLPLSPSYGELFGVLTGAIVVLLAFAAIQRGGLLRALKGSSKGDFSAIFRNSLSSTVVILGATLLATVMLGAIQSSVGIQAGGISGDPLDLLVSFTLAPFIEEIGYRFFLIGVPLFALMLVTGSPMKQSARSLWRPSAAWEQETSFSDSHKLVVYLLIAVSSVLFGLAHYLSGAGWQVGKISEAALDGFALGYLYARYGLHSSIIFHWAVDYASNAFAFYGQAVYDIPWTSNSVFSVVPTVDILVLVGVPGFFYLTYRFIMWWVNSRKALKTDEPAAIPTTPQPA